MNKEVACQIARELLPEAQKNLATTPRDAAWSEERFINEVAWNAVSGKFDVTCNQGHDDAFDVSRYLYTLLANQNAPLVVQTLIGSSQETIGSFAVIDGRTLVCVVSEYNPGDDEDNIKAGYYSGYAEPTAEQAATPEFVAATQQAVKDAEKAAQQGAMLRRISNADQAGATGRDSTLTERQQSLLDDLFGDD